MHGLYNKYNNHICRCLTIDIWTIFRIFYLQTFTKTIQLTFLSLCDECQINKHNRYITLIQLLRSTYQWLAQPLFEQLISCLRRALIYITAMLHPPHPEVTREFVMILSLCSRLFEPGAVGFKERARWSVLAKRETSRTIVEVVGFRDGYRHACRCCRGKGVPSGDRV